ncbi:MAG: glycosyltransferase family 2 protein [candidate division Zixibacteria bacterium]|nr:glycosyltransferase family 2 protein [candidate division Zixibacteria bacterium]
MSSTPPQSTDLSTVPARPLDVSVVVGSWNSAAFLERCLDAVYVAARGRDIEVIVVDDASTDGSAAFVHRQFPQVKLIENSRNLGVSATFNRGMEQSGRSFIQLLCSDTFIHPESLDTLASFLETHSETGAVGPRLVYPDGRPQLSCRTFPTFLTFVWEFSGLSRLLPKHPVFGKWRMGDFDHQTLREVDQPRGSSLMVRREIWQQIGGWDEHLPMFFNDVDWCLRIRQHGWIIHFVPGAVMTHYGGGSVNQVRPHMILASHRCCYRYFRKHRKGWLERFGVYALGIALTASAGVRYAHAWLSGVGRHGVRRVDT